MVPDAATVMATPTISARVEAGGFRTLNEKKWPDDDTSPETTNFNTPSASVQRL